MWNDILDFLRRERIGRKVVDFVLGIASAQVDPASGAVIRSTPRWLASIRGAKVITQHDAHYDAGRKLLQSARQSVVVLSTLKHEDLTKKAKKSPKMREYFVELQRLVYGNRYRDKPIRVTRFVDLSDSDKCGEAVSFLYHGTGVEIRDSKSPVEFLVVDDTSVLVGFPSRDQKLAKGFLREADANLCSAMLEWIEHVNPPNQERKLASREDLMGFSARGDHGQDCMCQVVPLLSELSMSSAEAFSSVAEWYPGLYSQDRTDIKAKYRNLIAHWAETKLLDIGKRPSMLDVGCGPAIGAEVLSEKFDYWGVDASGALLEKGDKADMARGHFIAADIFEVLLGVHPGKEARKLPRSFSVIACQGNTFDHFLGLPQKELALYLFDRRLKPGGLLLLTGSPFHAKPDQLVREICNPYGTTEQVDYRFNWLGNFASMNVPAKLSEQDRRVTFLIHRHKTSWLHELLTENLGYRAVNGYPGPWFGPGGTTYELEVFQKQ